MAYAKPTTFVPTNQPMRSVIGILLALLLLATSWQDLLLYAVFKLEQDHLAKIVCQNKTKPELDCRASCYFQTELNKNHEQEQKKPLAPASAKEKTPFHFSVQKPLCLKDRFPLQKQGMHIDRKMVLPPSPLLQGIFKPPIQLS